MASRNHDITEKTYFYVKIRICCCKNRKKCFEHFILGVIKHVPLNLLCNGITNCIDR